MPSTGSTEVIAAFSSLAVEEGAESASRSLAGAHCAVAETYVEGVELEAANCLVPCDPDQYPTLLQELALRA